MAPRNNTAAVNLSFAVDSASEDEMARDINSFPTPDSNTENKAPTRKGRGKATAQTAKSALATKKIAKAKTTARRASGGSVLGVRKEKAAVAKKAGAKPGRKALAERQNADMGDAGDTEEVDEFEGEDEIAEPVEEPKPARRGRPAKVKKVQEDQ
ncbi:hypothetical protein BCR34DRAFT_453916, partial [Clohesyomyces aquaticus]